jgi:hypothetical protein
LFRGHCRRRGVRRLAGAGWTILLDDTAALFQRWQWNDRPVVVTIVIVAAVGLLALLIGLWRRHL